MFHNLDQLRLHLERENLHGVNAKTCLQALRTQFKEFLASKGVNATDLLNQGWQQDFEYFTRCEPSAYRRELLENLDTLEAVIHRVVNTYGVLRMKENELNALKENGSQLHDEILHEHQIKSSVKMQSQDIQINPVQAMDDSLIVSKGSLIEPENNHAFSKSEIETQMQRQEENVNMREAVDAGLVVTESSGSYTTQAVDADIGPVHDDEPFAEVQLTALHNILANEQQHTEQSEPSYDTHLLETIDSNTTPTSTNMCHRGGEIDQDALLKTELLKTKDMVDKEIYNELSKRFLQLEKHNGNRTKGFLSISLPLWHEKPHTPRSCLRWKPTGRIFKTVSLRWIPTGKVFIDSTTKVDSEPPNGSNDDITNPYECNQTLYVSAGTSKLKCRPRSSLMSLDNSSSLVLPKTVQTSFLNVKWRLLASLQALFLKVKKGVRLQRKGKYDGEKYSCTLNLQDEMNRSFIAQNSYRLERETFSKIYRNPEPMQEDQTGSNSGKLHVSLAGPNPEHMDDEFLATAYPKVHGKNLKLSLTGAMCHRRKSEKSILVLHNSCTKSCKFLDEGDEWSDFRERCGDCLLASVLIGFHEPLGRFVARTSYQCAQGLVQAKRTCNFPEFDPVWFFLHGSRVGPDTILAWRVILLRLPKRSALKSNHVSSSLKTINPSLCIMSQSIPEQLNVDRREFADAVNALTKFVFLKYQLKYGRYDSSATSVDLREGFPFQSVTVLSNEGSVHLILRTPSLYFKEQMPTDLTLRNEDIIGEACSLDLKIPWNS
ncbi:hypothetical protein Tco_0704881 [Tanacetum coccineum]|uniref:Uncharacterized protein n=1 Tax=Tanacetum coccineum TaxID=301880 RepID=A0ABQ4Y4T4_9ASTR